MINWKVRVKNKWFWLALIPAMLVLIKAIASVTGVDLDLSDLGDKLIAVVEALFSVLAYLRDVLYLLRYDDVHRLLRYPPGQ